MFNLTPCSFYFRKMMLNTPIIAQIVVLYLGTFGLFLINSYIYNNTRIKPGL